MTVCLPSCQISLNWPLELATSGGEITYIVTLLTIYVTQLIKHLIRSAWPCPQVTCPDHDRYILLFPHYSCHFTWAPSYLTPVTNLDCVWRYICYRGKGQCLRALYFREELVLCLDHSVQIPHSQHYLFQAILCCMHLPYKQQFRQWPACMSSQASTLIVDVSLRHMQHLWLASTVPQGWQNPVNFAQSH